MADGRRELLEARARLLARVADEPARAGEVLELVVFVLGGERYGIESRFVREVARLTRFTPVPGASLAQTETAWGRAYVRGLSPDGVIVLSAEALLNDPRLTIDPEHDSRPAA